MASYTFLWNNDTWDAWTSEGEVGIGYVAGDRKRPVTNVRTGDEIFVVRVKAQRLYVGGRLTALKAPVNKSEAEKLLPAIPLIDKELYVVGDQSHMDIFRPNLSLSAKEVRELEFLREGDITHKEFSETSFQQDFRTPQVLSEASAEKLRALLSLTPAASKPDDDQLDDYISHSIINGDTEDVLALRAIKTRRGQPDFRRKLLEAYGSRCCITGCNVEAVLEAAHIRSHAEESDYSTTNGLLLRADIHTLFDLHLLCVDEMERVIVSTKLRSSEYWKLNGQRLALPIKLQDRASSDSLVKRHQMFLNSESGD